MHLEYLGFIGFHSIKLFVCFSFKNGSVKLLQWFIYFYYYPMRFFVRINFSLVDDLETELIRVQCRIKVNRNMSSLAFKTLTKSKSFRFVLFRWNPFILTLRSYFVCLKAYFVKTLWAIVYSSNSFSRRSLLTEYKRISLFFFGKEYGL